MRSGSFRSARVSSMSSGAAAGSIPHVDTVVGESWAAGCAPAVRGGAARAGRRRQFGVVWPLPGASASAAKVTGRPITLASTVGPREATLDVAEVCPGATGGMVSLSAVVWLAYVGAAGVARGGWTDRAAT